MTNKRPENSLLNHMWTRMLNLLNMTSQPTNETHDKVNTIRKGDRFD